MTLNEMLFEGLLYTPSKGSGGTHCCKLEVGPFCILRVNLGTVSYPYVQSKTSKWWNCLYSKGDFHTKG